MLKTLLVMRHAKSSWDAQFTSDSERPLNQRGCKDAPKMGEWLAEHELAPDVIVGSPAERAKGTVEGVMEGGGFEGEVIYDERIYEATVGLLFDVIAELPEHVDRALLVGHNPGLEGFIAALCGARVRLVTAAIACIELGEQRWQNVGRGSGELQWLVRPKLLE